MVGITLTPEQIRTAPIEVRHWIEGELAASLGLRPGGVAQQEPNRQHLVACSIEEAAAVPSLIQGMFPAASVFFELGRQGDSFGSEGLEAFRLLDILKHTRLSNVTQVIGCLDIINEAVRRVREDPMACLYVLDNRGACIVAAPTQQSISELWRQITGQTAAMPFEELQAADKMGQATGSDAPVSGPAPIAGGGGFGPNPGSGGNPDSRQLDGSGGV